MGSVIAKRYAVGIGAAAALLAGCGGLQPPSRAYVAQGSSFSQHHHFVFTGKRQSFRVPPNVGTIRVIARGALGGGSDGGNGERVAADIPVTPGEVLAVYVGGVGSSLGSGGFNGGGNGGSGPHCVITTYSAYCYGGGGATDIRRGGDKLSDRIIVAAGGGGQGAGLYSCQGGSGGVGGGKHGGTGATGGGGYGGSGGSGGTQRRGGSGGSGGSGPYSSGKPGSKGALGAGGAGGEGSTTTRHSGAGGDGGGGGGGYYGGGGGGAGGGGWGSNEARPDCGSGYGNAGAGGGGGSSYVEDDAHNARFSPAPERKTGDGALILRW